jgi:two-component system chemotaxis response regulator CheY
MNALVIDDAKVMRMILKQILQKIGFDVAEAANGREGLEQLKKLGKPDLTLVDCHMPEMNGLEFVQAVRADANFRDLRLLMVTAEEEPAELNQALAAGANDYVVKPFRQEVILEKLHRLGIVAN